MNEILLRDIWKLLPEAEDIEILQMPAVKYTIQILKMAYRLPELLSI